MFNQYYNPEVIALLYSMAVLSKFYDVMSSHNGFDKVVSVPILIKIKSYARHCS